VLIVVEGASAAGKTTWCRRFAVGHALLEGEPKRAVEPAGASDPNPSDPMIAAQYWTEINSHRWATALAMSEALGWVACDTDPFKLHWTWTLWVEGLASRAYWDACRELNRAAFANEALGLADLVFFADLDEATLRRQKESDTTRPRSRHELHVRIAPALRRWYCAIASLDCERVRFQLPAAGIEPAQLQPGRRSVRTGKDLFDRLMRELARQ
jgi:hypothetical protein